MRNALLACAALLILHAGVYAAVQDSGPATLLKEREADFLDDSVHGHEMKTYTVFGRAGEWLNVGLNASNRFLYFNVRSPSGEALQIGAESLIPNRFKAKLPSDGLYHIELYLMRNEARRGRTAPFTLYVARGDAALTGPSFDCAKARQGAERVICTTPPLMVLDREMQAVFDQAIARALKMGTDVSDKLRSDQREWMASRDKCGGRAIPPHSCLGVTYHERIAELKAYQMSPADKPPL